MCANKSDQNRQEGADHYSELAALRTKLARLVKDDLETVIAFQMPDPTVTTAAVAHRKRTAQYKTQLLLALAPDSQAVAQACSYLVLGQIEKEGNGSAAIRRYLVTVLDAAGYERDQIEFTLDRLAVDVVRRRRTWQRSQVRKLSAALAQAIRRFR